MRKKHKKPLKVLLFQMAAIALFLWGGWAYIADRFSLGIDVQQEQCLPYKVFLIDKHDKNIPRDGYVAFLQDDRAEPWNKAGSTFVKQVRAVGKDVVRVDSGNLYINGVFTEMLQPRILSKIDKQAKSLDRNTALAQGDLWVMGTTENSFDSRYWGPINQSMVTGQAYPLF